MRLSCLRQRKSRAYDWLQRAIEHQAHHAHKIAVRGHCAADNADLLAENVAQIDLSYRAAGVAHDEDAPAFAQRSDTPEQRVFPDIIHDHVHALAVRARKDSL